MTDRDFRVMAFPVNEHYIIESERDLGLKFPPAFKKKMIKENGGEIEASDDSWIIHPFFDKSDINKIKRTTNNIVLETRNSREWENFPINGVAIADNGTGDKMILLAVDGDSTQLSDSIYLWLHETGEVEKLADSIDDLLE